MFHNFAECMSEGQPVYVVDMKPFYKERSNFLIDELAVQCLDLLLKKQESGPYYLCGYSFGGFVAYEVAVLLLQRGEEVGVLVLFDAANPAFRSNLSAAESAQFQATYLSSRLKKYGRNFLTGDFKALAIDAVAFISPRIGPLWSLISFLFELIGHPLPKILQNNDPIIVAACRVYRPSPYTRRLVIFRSLGRGPEFDRDPTLGWDRCATGGIDVHFVPGNHVNLLGFPNVRGLVEMLKPYLDGGQRRTAESVCGLQSIHASTSGEC